eukprot:2675493-Amphidinium_carterae.1
MPRGPVVLSSYSLCFTLPFAALCVVRGVPSWAKYAPRKDPFVVSPMLNGDRAVSDRDTR